MDATDIDEQTRDAEIEAITQVVATHPDPGRSRTGRRYRRGGEHAP